MRKSVPFHKIAISCAAFICLCAITSVPKIEAGPLKSPGQATPEEGASGEAPSGTGYASPGVIVHPTESGVVYPERGPGRQFVDKFDPGKYSDEEQAVIQKTLPGANPRKTIAEYVAKFKSGGQRPMWSMSQLIFLHDESLARSFPGKLFYLIRFAQWPIGFDVPPPLGNNNIFVVDKAKALKLMTTSDQLQTFFKGEVHGVTDARDARVRMKAWLNLSKELANDGMFKFNIPDASIVIQPLAGGLSATGKAIVDPVGGNCGDITATIAFAGSGDIQDIKEIVSLQAGMRPICQSTKLLDSDPIVRKMARQDLLIMGKSAQWYLDNQRKTASPELQKAIDEIWQEIVESGR